MSMDNNYFDLFQMMMGEEVTVSDDGPKKIREIDEVFINSLNELGCIDIEYIADQAGMPVEDAIGELKGVIFQDPAYFEDDEPYDIKKGWVILPYYISGNVKMKIKLASKMNKKIRGAFASNIQVLQKVLPDHVSFEDIHISLASPWISVDMIALFMKQFLRLNQFPDVVYNKDVGRYKVVTDSSDRDSVLNNTTYGVSEVEHMNFYSYSKQYLTAAEIIEQTLNGKICKVYDYIPNYSSKSRCSYEAILNRDKTLEAQRKQQMIDDAFVEWVCSKKERMAQLEEYYNESMVGYAIPKYDGGFLKFPGLNPDINLFKHQRNAIARVLLSDNNVLLAHDVGAGKTYEIIVSVHELKRMGRASKIIITVPNSTLQAIVKEHRKLYKDDKILVVYPKDFTPEKRNAVLEKIRDNDYDAIYMAYSSFDMIVMSKQYYINKMAKEINKLKAALTTVRTTYDKVLIESNMNQLKRKLKKYVEEEKECKWLTFDQLGIDTLVVDEAHYYKNIPTRSNTDNVVGFSNSGSKKCCEMLEKVHFVKKVIFATGTPLTNSQADLFAFQLYLQPNVLEYHDLNFDRWINTFGHKESTIECDVDANSKNLRTMVRFTSFHNLGELMSLFAQVCDFYRIKENDEGLPEFNGYEDILVPKNKAQMEYTADLSVRTDRIRKGEVKREEDNLLKVTTDGRKAALDVRLTDYDGQLDFSTESKIRACARKICEIDEKYPDTTQIVFSDIGTPKASFNAYDCLADELVFLGMQRDKIAFVHDATTESARSKLFADMNKGKIKVVVGSTPKLGIGVNIQEKLIALHHLSVPWRPADMVQRQGRILRKGNTCKEIFIYRYITEGSFDAYSWQLLENKQKFIASFLSGVCVAREMDDIADTVLSYAEVKALAIGNPLIKKRVEVANELEHAKIDCRSRQKQLQKLREIISSAPGKIKKHEELARVAGLEYQYYSDNKEKIPNDKRIAFGTTLILILYKNSFRSQESLFDTYQGFDVILPANMTREHPYVIIRGPYGGEYYCEMELDKQPRGYSMSIDYLLEHLKDRVVNNNKAIEKIKKQVAEAQSDLDQDNCYLDEVERLKKKLEQIDAMLEEFANQEQKAS